MLTTLIVCLAQFGMGAGAWKLANQLKKNVDDHELRITDHHVRLGRLETRV